MTDAIIVQRYIEFSIGADGIRIGAMLPGQKGLLGGRLTQKCDASPPIEGGLGA